MFGCSCLLAELVFFVVCVGGFIFFEGCLTKSGFDQKWV